VRCACFVALSACVWATCTRLFFNGYTDDYYLRVASPRQTGLIVGTSRAAQGLVPAEIDARALGASAAPYNFAFASSLTRYGRAYFEAIGRKLAEQRPAQIGVFLLEVSPLAISIDATGTREFPEQETFVGKLSTFASDPNVEYPFYAARRGYDIIDRSVRRWRGTGRLFLHDDGWLEVKPVADASIELNIQQKLVDYAQVFSVSRHSPERSEYLERTIVQLVARGRVALVVMPIDPRLRALEWSYMPDFDDRMRVLAERSRATYLDLSDLDARVVTNDGNHLRQDWARAVSREVSARLERAWAAPRPAR
jgi:hypothetical protein